MTTRRTFLTTSAAVTAGLALGMTEQASAKPALLIEKYTGPHELPKGLTLLSLHNADGTETLGIKSGSIVIDVRAASKLLGIPAPLTLEELLREGNAAALNKIAAAGGSEKSNLPCFMKTLLLMAGYLPIRGKLFVSV